MFNCLYNTPLSFNNPAAFPVAFNYITGIAQGGGFPWMCGNNFKGQIPSVGYPTQNYTFTGGNRTTNPFSGCNSGLGMPKMYNFTGGRSGSNIFSSCGDTIGYIPKMYNFTGGSSRNIFSGCGSSGSSYNFTGNIFASNTSSPLSAIKSGNTSATGVIKMPAQKTKTSAANKSAKTNNISDNSSINTSKIPKMKSTLKTSISQECINTAVTYIGDSEDNGRAAKFTKTHNCPNPKEWCADFVTYVTYEACNRQGKTPPAGFGSHDVRTMKNWAIKNGYFVRTSNIADNGKYFISMNIKPGNIIILNENGASHTGFVERVDWDGTIHTVEGNRDDKVTRAAYEPSSKDYKNISGFIQLA